MEKESASRFFSPVYIHSIVSSYVLPSLLATVFTMFFPSAKVTLSII